MCVVNTSVQQVVMAAERPYKYSQQDMLLGKGKQVHNYVNLALCCLKVRDKHSGVRTQAYLSVLCIKLSAETWDCTSRTGSKLAS